LGGRAEHAVARDHLLGEIAHEVQLVVLIVTPRAWEVQLDRAKRNPTDISDAEHNRVSE
jgi:hypothetical protein